MAKITLPPEENIKAILASLPKEEEYPDLPSNILCKDLTLEELRKTQHMKDKLYYVMIEFKYGSGKNKYKSVFFPDYVEKSLFHLYPDDSSKVKLIKTATIIEDYYSTERGSIWGEEYLAMSIIIPESSKFTPEKIVHDIENFFMVRFKDVKFIKAFFENVTKEDLILAKIPKDKIEYVKKNWLR